MDNNITVPQMRSNFYAFRVGRFIDEIMATEDVFQEKLDRAQVILQLTEQMETLSFEEFLAIEDQAFRQKVGRFMAAQLTVDLWEAEEPCSEVTH